MPRQNNRFKFSTLCFSLFLTLGIAGQSAQAQTTKTPDRSLSKLSSMFSPSMRAIINACDKQGDVNSAAGPDRDGSVICANGWRKSPVKFVDYADMKTDLFSALFLVGLRSELQKRSGMGEALKSPEAQARLVKLLQSSSQDRIFGLSKPYQDRMVRQVMTFLKEPQSLENLFGTSGEYGIVVENFCSPKGQSIAAARKLVPNLSATQMYAVCVSETGFSFSEKPNQR